MSLTTLLGTRVRSALRAAAVVAAAVPLAFAADAGRAGASPSGVVAPARGVLFGAHVNPRNGLSQLASIAAFEREIGRRLDVANKYHGFSDHDYAVERS